MKKFFPAAIVCLSVLIACNKSKVTEVEPPQLPVELVLKSLTYGAPKVYGNTAEVTDTALIAAAKISTNYFIYGFRDATYAPGDYPTMYINGTSTMLTATNAYRGYSGIKTGNDFEFTSTDSAVFRIPVYGDGDYASYVSEPFLRYAQYTLASNGMVIKRVKLAASGNYSKLTVKGVVIAIVKRNPVTKAFLSNAFNSCYNEFNINGLPTLNRYDTLITRPFDLIYERK